MIEEKQKAIKEVISNAIVAISKTLDDVDSNNIKEIKAAAYTCASIQRCALAQAKAIAQQPNLENFESGGSFVINRNSGSVVVDNSEIVVPMNLEQRRESYMKASSKND